MCMTCSCKSRWLIQTDPELRYDPDGWEPTESPVDQLSFSADASGQTGDGTCCLPLWDPEAAEVLVRRNPARKRDASSSVV